MQRLVPRQSEQYTQLDHMDALVEDALALCLGTFTTFGREAGQQISYNAEEIDAPTELRMLCQRLQRTNARDDLNFAFKKEPGFPTLRMDRKVFTSVFYSLIHNAMKYANRQSRVSLECGFERPSNKAVLKLKSYGVPIHPSEREQIFHKYQRGAIVEKTGRSHGGVGLGLWVARELMRSSGGDLTVELSPTHPELSVFIVHVAEEASPL
jgi:signal transduction histidine kinase